MIHSLSGGVLKHNQNFNIAKVEIMEGLGKGQSYFYISNINHLKENDIVLVPYGKNDTLIKGLVLRLDKNVSEQNLPFGVRKMKEVFKIVENK